MRRDLVSLTGLVPLDQHHAFGETLILDGATGTEIERRGFPMHDIAWSGAVMFEKPDLVRTIHEDYIRAGANIITANSYSCCRHVLEPAGFGDRVEAANRLAISLAKQARDNAAHGRQVAVAGSISMFVADEADPYLKKRSDIRDWRSPESLSSCYREQASLLADAGADLLLLEMFQIPEWSIPAIEAALETGLPVWLGISCGSRNQQGNVRMCSWPDRMFRETASELIRPDLAAVCVMHSEVEDIAGGLELVREYWSGPLGAYAHSGGHVHPKWIFENVIAPDDYADQASQWQAKYGLSLIGGCCGTRPDHIKVLSEKFG
jgi:S-methylmethionine-dependent homocysteine/selenocysteine methylase